MPSRVDQTQEYVRQIIELAHDNPIIYQLWRQHEERGTTLSEALAEMVLELHRENKRLVDHMKAVYARTGMNDAKPN